MTAYYNENDPKAAAWLRELIKGGHIAAGEVDERSIRGVSPSDLQGFAQCHFFAGIGGWSYALRLAGWPDDRPVWTGSCPCQPFSAAGKRKGTADERHLWPEFMRLVAECRPDTIFGEQVASAIGAGWLDGISADLEAEGYACGAAVLGAHSVGAPHIRQRLFWVADAQSGKAGSGNDIRSGEPDLGCCGPTRWVADADQGQRGRFADGEGRERDREAAGRVEGNSIVESSCDPGRLEHAPSDGRIERRAGPDGRGAAARCGAGGVGHALDTRLEGHAGHGHNSGEPGWLNSPPGGPVAAAGGSGFWSNAILIPCADGKARRTQPGIQPLAHGVSNRVGLLRGAGNAIVPQAAAEFIRAYCESSVESVERRHAT